MAITSAAEKYILAIYQISELYPGEPIALKSIAEKAGTAPGNVPNAMRTLSDMGLVVRILNQGVLLTDEGKRLALELLRRES